MRSVDWLADLKMSLQRRTAQRSPRNPSRRRRQYVEGLETRLCLSVTAAQQALTGPEWFQVLNPATTGSSSTSPGGASAGSTTNVGPALPERNFLVRLTTTAANQIGSVAAAQDLFGGSNLNLRVSRGLGLPGQLLVTTTERDTVRVVDALRANPHVAHFEEDSRVGAADQIFPNEQNGSPQFVRQHGLHNTGQNGGTVDADIDAPEAWDISIGNLATVVAVVDSGVDYTHPDLYLNIWINQGELPDRVRSRLSEIDIDPDGSGLQFAADGLITFRDLNAVQNRARTIDGQPLVQDLNGNGYIDAADLLDDPSWADGIDTDRNGFEDDLVGWDFFGDDNRPFDEHGHGTHVAGIIGAAGDNGFGVVGVNWQTSLMPLRFLDQDNRGDVSDAINAINYTTLMRTRSTPTASPVDIRVSNNSWGSPGSFSQSLFDAVAGNREADILFVAAAGNGDVLGHGINNDTTPFYPANLDLDNVISVAALNDRGELSGFSNFGRRSVDIAAPGVDIVSTEPGTGFVSRNGTSMAVPHVTGVAALVLDVHPDASPVEVRQAILEGAETPSAISGNVSGGRSLNAFGALTASTFAPVPQLEPVPAVTTSGGTQLDLSVTFTDDEGIDVSTIDGADLEIARPGFSREQFAMISVDVTGSGSSVTAVYHLQPPGGIWDATDNSVYGEYRVTLNPGAVADLNGIRNGRVALGQFSVQIGDSKVYFVTSGLDTVDANLGDGLPRDAAGNVTIRSAVMQANASIGAETIVIPDGTYVLTVPGPDEDSARTGDIDITGNLVILGGGRLTTTISGNRIDRVFDVVSPSPQVSVTLRGLTITGGLSGSTGGAIRNAGSLTASDLGLTASSAATEGGGLHNRLGASATLSGALIQNNQSMGNFAFGGGGIFNEGTLTVQETTIHGNTANGGLLNVNRGGAGGLQNSPLATADLTNVTISGNVARNNNGGGIFNSGILTATHVTVTQNSSGVGVAGGIYNDFGPPSPELIRNFGAIGVGNAEFHPNNANRDMAFSSDDHLYVVDSLNSRVQAFDESGAFLFAFGENGTGPGQFDEPRFVTVAADGTVFVIDASKRIQAFDNTGTFLRSFTTTSITGALASDDAGNLYVLDNGVSSRVVRRLDAEGNRLEQISQIAGQTIGFSFNGLAVTPAGTIAVGGFNQIFIEQPDGTSATISLSVRFRDIYGGSDGTFYVAVDSVDGITNRGELRQYDVSGNLLRTLDRNNTSPFPFASESPSALAATSAGHVFAYSSDYTNTILAFDDSGFDFAFGRENSNSYPVGIAAATGGSAYVANTRDAVIHVHDPSGNRILTFGSKGSGTGQLSDPTDVDVFGDEVFVVDSGNDRIQVYDTTGAYLRSIGNGSGSSTGQFSSPRRIDIDPSGNLYVADTGNHRIQKLNRVGDFLMAYGVFGSSVGQFNQPVGVAVNADGTLYVADAGNDRVQAVDVNGIASNFVSLSGTPESVSLDDAGRLYVTIKESNSVEVYAPNGAQTYVFGGTGTQTGRFSGILDVEASGGGRLFVTDSGNDRISLFNALSIYRAEATLTNSMVAGNVAVADADLQGDFVSGGGNAIGIIDRATTGFDEDQSGTTTIPLDTMLLPLASRGDGLPVHVPAVGSPLLDAGSAETGLAFDQLGHPRPNDANGDGMAVSDSGAVERFLADLSGSIFLDRNGNGLHDADELGFGGQRVYADLNGNQRPDADEPSTLSEFDDPRTQTIDETGRFSIRQLEPGVLLIAVEHENGLIITSPARADTSAQPTITLVTAGGISSFDTVPAVSKDRVLVNFTALTAFDRDGQTSILYDGVAVVQVDDAGTMSRLTRLQNVFTDGEIVAFNALIEGTGNFGTFLYDGIEIRRIAVAETRLPDASDTFRGDNLIVRGVDQGIILLQGNGTVSSERGFFAATRSGQIIRVVDTQTPRFPNDSGSPTFSDLQPLGGLDGGIFVFSGTVNSIAERAVYERGIGNVYRPLVRAGDAVPGGTDTFLDFPGPARTEDGQTFFYARTTSGRKGIYRAAGDGQISIVVDSATELPMRASVVFVGQASSVVSLNDNFGFAVDAGRIVFRGVGSDGSFGIYLWENGFITRLIDNSQQIEGRSVVSLTFGGDALSRDRFTFLAELSPFRLGVYTINFPVRDNLRINAVAGIAVDGLQFGLQPEIGAITGAVFIDNNLNGTFDAGEVTVNAASVFVDLNENRLREVNEPLATTDDEGAYEFSEVEGLRELQLVLVPPEGLTATTPGLSPGIVTVQTLAGDTLRNVNFGIAATDAAGAAADGVVNGIIFQDANGNGQRDVGELVSAGVTVFVDENSDRILNGGERSTTTAADGSYRLDQLTGTRQAVRVVTPTAVRQVSPLGNTFTRTTLPTDETPVEVIAVDADQDGDEDLVASLDGVNVVQFFMNDGSGSFAPATRVPVETGPGSLAVGRFRGPSQAPGIVVGHRISNNVVVLSRQANAGWSSTSLVSQGQTVAGQPLAALGSSPYVVTTGDFDGDGDDDIAVASQNAFPNGGAVVTFLSNGDGTFTREQIITLPIATADSPTAITAANLAGTSAIDLAVACGTSNSVAVLRNTEVAGAGRFVIELTRTTSGRFPSSVQAGDLNGDGRKDLVTTDFSSGVVSVFFANASGSFDAPIALTAATAASAQLSDIDRNGSLDIVFSSSVAENRFGILRNRGGGMFQAAETSGLAVLPNGTLAFTVAVGQFNDDNGDNVINALDRPDVAITNRRDPSQAASVGSITRGLNTIVAGALRIDLPTGTRSASGLDFALQPINQPPTLNVILDPASLPKNSGQQTVSFSGASAGIGEGLQNFRVTAISGNTTLIPSVAVQHASGSASGSIQFTPAQGQSGSADISVTVTDAGLDVTFDNADDLSFTRTFRVMVSAVENPPPAVDENIFVSRGTSGALLSVLANEDAANSVAGQTLQLLFARPPSQGGTVELTSDARRLRYTPPQNFVGMEIIRYTISNGGSFSEATASVYVANTVNLTADARPLSIRVTAGQMEVLRSGSADLGFLPVAAANVGAIVISGNEAANSIDLSAVTASAFTLPTGVQVSASGLGGNDTLLGSPFGDSLDGGDGNDVLTGGPGNDTLAGGAGANILREAADFNMTVTNSELVMTKSGFAPANDALSDIFLLELTGGTSRNRIDASGFVTGTGPVHTLVGAGGIDTIIGTNGRDKITTFSSGADSINGLDGNDTVMSGNGNDTVDGGAGDDCLQGQDGDDSLLGSDGNDMLFGNFGNDVLDGGAGADRLNGLQDNDRLLGGTENDSLFGDAGNDTLAGGPGNDQLRGSFGSDSFDGGSGASDRVDEAGDNHFTLIGMQLSSPLLGNDTAVGVERFDLTGGPSANRIDARQATVMVILNGMGGNDTLGGGSGNDLLFGGDGDDILNGGSGNDRLEGGEGHDGLSGYLGNDSLFGQNGSDTLYGHDGADQLSGGDLNDTVIGGGGTSIGGDLPDTLDGGNGTDTRGTATGDSVTSVELQMAFASFPSWVDSI